MGRFSGIESASSSEGGVYLLPGAYRLKVDAIKTGTSRKKRDFFVAEFSILESNNPERPAGTKASWMVMLDLDTALGNIKDFLETLSGGDVDEEGVELAVSAANPFAGLEIKASAANVKTKKGTDFTKVQWEAAK